jgi:hypothetical protein
MCSKIDASQQDKKFLLEQIFELGLVPRWEQKMGGPEFPTPHRISRQNARHAAETPEGPKGLWGLIETRLIQKRLLRRAFFQDRLGAFVANCSS